MIAQPSDNTMPPRSEQKLSPQEYLLWEAEQPWRYGYIAGQAYATTGGTIPHNQIAVNLIALLRPHLRGKGCRVLSSDAKVGITDQGPFHYPDLSVTCDQRDQDAREYIRYPCLLVEVLSPSTEAFDRGQKFRHYRRISTLQEYVLISPEQMSVECYRLNAQGRWELFHYTCESDGDCPANPADTLELTSIQFSLSFEQLYEDITLIAEPDS
ncbi:MAG: Uma2 family endonuclease [Leptolyngbyaceae cyanobacterium]